MGSELKAFDEQSSKGHALKRTLGSRRRDSFKPEQATAADDAGVAADTVDASGDEQVGGASTATDASALNDGLVMDTDKVTVADCTDDTVDATGDTTVGGASKLTGEKPSRGPALKRTLGSRRRSAD